MHLAQLAPQFSKQSFAISIGRRGIEMAGGALQHTLHFRTPIPFALIKAKLDWAPQPANVEFLRELSAPGCIPLEASP